MTQRQRIWANIIMHSAVVVGRVSLLAFGIFLFAGPFYKIPMNMPMGWLTWDVLLSLLFFLQHSSMVRRGLRDRLTGVVPAYYHDAIYCLASGFALVLVMVLWQSSNTLLMALQGPLRWMARGLFIAAAMGGAWGAMALKELDPYGKGPIKARLSGRSLKPPPFTIQGPYKFVRHPLYFFTLVMIWSCPDLTADRLVLNVLWSIWIYIGAVLEEKDLRLAFGDSYIRYQQKVPMLVPWKGIKKRTYNPY